MNKILLILLMVIFSINKAQAKGEVAETSRLRLHCIRLNDEGVFAIYRCFNDEVVCYVMSGIQKGGMSCRFKNAGEIN